uniref:Uncharacterized protein n=1 Tax=Acrobeloides nanus TaxID=290746 RepID=A0A914E670_9BILA
MLFAALICQTMNLIIFLFIPVSIATIVIANRYKYSSYVALFGICAISMHGLADIMAIIYFIKPYRKFFGRILEKISMKLYVSPNVSSAGPNVIGN